MLEVANYLQTKTYPSWRDRELIQSLSRSHEGVLSDASFKVTESAPAANTVLVAVGRAFIQADNAVNKGFYHVWSTAALTVGPFVANSSGFTRYDIVYLRVFDPADNPGDAAQNPQLLIAQGVPGVTPSDPAIPMNAIPLARARLASGYTTIPNSVIDDLREPRWHFIGGIGEPAWVTSWGNYAAGYEVAYRRTPFQTVQFRGLAKSLSAWAAPITLFTLPVDFRPAMQRGHIVSGAGRAARIILTPAGAVTLDGVDAGTAYTGIAGEVVYLDSLSFPIN